MKTHLLLLAMAGAAGTLARYMIQAPFQAWAGRITNLAFPWGTLPVNAIGCFLFGLIWSLSHPLAERQMIGLEARLIILTGFMGAFTTFSTFGFETGELLLEGRYGAATLNIAVQNIVGITLALLGIGLGRLVVGPTVTGP